MSTLFFRSQGISLIQSIKMKSSRSLNSVLVDCWQSNSVKKVFTVSFCSLIIDDQRWKVQFWSTRYLGEWHFRLYLPGYVFIHQTPPLPHSPSREMCQVFWSPQNAKKVLVCLRLDYILSKTITWFYFHENENFTNQTE